MGSNTYAMAGGLLKAPLPFLSLPARGGVCIPSYVFSSSATARLQHTPLPAHRFARFVTSANGEPQQPAAASKANLLMTHSKLICCKIYISESRNTSVIAEIDKAAWSKPDDVVVLSKFGDYFYNRVRYTLVSYVPQQNSSPAGENPMKDVLMKMVDAAITNIDLTVQQYGAHPRMGVIDDVSFHPLGDTNMEDAAQLANEVAKEMGKRVPVFLYGEAHPNKRQVGKIRRELGYFDEPDSSDGGTSDNYSRGPDIKMVHNDVFRKSGATTVGAAPFLEGYNVPIRCENDADRTKVKDIVKQLRAQLGVDRGNQGLPKVLAIALPHGDGIEEVACLLDPNHVSANQVQEKIKEIAAEKELGDKVEKGYYTDITKDTIPVTLAMP